MKIDINNQADSKIALTSVKRTITEFARVYKVKAKEISIAFVSDAKMKKINQTYRGVNRPTDVLSFEGEGDDFGEIVLDYNQIKRQAGEFNHSAQEELIFILVHGLLHLLGYNDETEKEKAEMIKRGEEFIKKFKL